MDLCFQETATRLVCISCNQSLKVEKISRFWNKVVCFSFISKQLCNNNYNYGGRIPFGKSRRTYLRQKQLDFQQEHFQKMAYNWFELISIRI